MARVLRMASPVDNSRLVSCADVYFDETRGPAERGTVGSLNSSAATFMPKFHIAGYATSPPRIDDRRVGAFVIA